MSNTVWTIIIITVLSFCPSLLNTVMNPIILKKTGIAFLVCLAIGLRHVEAHTVWHTEHTAMTHTVSLFHMHACMQKTLTFCVLCGKKDFVSPCEMCNTIAQIKQTEPWLVWGERLLSLSYLTDISPSVFHKMVTLTLLDEHQHWVLNGNKGTSLDKAELVFHSTSIGNSSWSGSQCRQESDKAEFNGTMWRQHG